MFLLIAIVGGIVGFLVGMGITNVSLNAKWIVLSALQVVVGSFGAVLPAVVYVLLRRSARARTSRRGEGLRLSPASTTRGGPSR